MSDTAHDQLRALLTRRQVLQRSSAAALGALVASAIPLAEPRSAWAQRPSQADGTLQAFADTIIPGRKVAKTALGHAIDPLAIAGVDSRPGAVEADALELYHDPEVGFDDLEPPFLAQLESQSLRHGSDFLHLGFHARVQVCLAGLDFSNQSRVLWEAAAAVPFTAFCAAALIHNATWKDAPGYRVMGLPGTAPGGYRHYSYRRRLSHERTRRGSLS